MWIIVFNLFSFQLKTTTNNEKTIHDKVFLYEYELYVV